MNAFKRPQPPKYITPKSVVDIESMTQLYSLVEQGNIGSVKDFLLGKSLNLDFPFNEKTLLNTILNIDESKMSEGKKLEFFKYFIEKPHCLSVNSFDSNHLYPLHVAVKKGYYDIVKYLLEEGANINAQTLNSLTPLHYATLITIKNCPKENSPLPLIEKDINHKKQGNEIMDQLIEIFMKKESDIDINNNGNGILYNKFIENMKNILQIYTKITDVVIEDLDMSSNIIAKIKDKSGSINKNELVNDFTLSALQMLKRKLQYPDRIIETDYDKDIIYEITDELEQIKNETDNINEQAININNQLTNIYNQIYNLLDKHSYIKKKFIQHIITSTDDTQLILKLKTDIIKNKNELSPILDYTFFDKIKINAILQIIKNQIDINYDEYNNIIYDDQINNAFQIVNLQIQKYLQELISKELLKIQKYVDNSIIQLKSEAHNLSNKYNMNMNNIFLEKLLKEGITSNNHILLIINYIEDKYGVVNKSNTWDKKTLEKIILKILIPTLDISIPDISTDITLLSNHYSISINIVNDVKNEFIKNSNINLLQILTFNIGYKTEYDICNNLLFPINAIDFNENYYKGNINIDMTKIEQNKEEHIIKALYKNYDKNLQLFNNLTSDTIAMKIFMFKILTKHDIYHNSDIINSSNENVIQNFVYTLLKQYYNKVHKFSDYKIINAPINSSILLRHDILKKIYFIENITEPKIDNYLNDDDGDKIIENFFNDYKQLKNNDSINSFIEILKMYWSMNLENSNSEDDNFIILNRKFTDYKKTFDRNVEKEQEIVSTFYSFCFMMIKRYITDRRFYPKIFNTYERIVKDFVSYLDGDVFNGLNDGDYKFNNVKQYIEIYDSIDGIVVNDIELNTVAQIDGYNLSNVNIDATLNRIIDETLIEQNINADNLSVAIKQNIKYNRYLHALNILNDKMKEKQTNINNEISQLRLQAFPNILNLLKRNPQNFNDIQNEIRLIQNPPVSIDNLSNYINLLIALQNKLSEIINIISINKNKLKNNTKVLNTEYNNLIRQNQPIPISIDNFKNASPIKYHYIMKSAYNFINKKFNISENKIIDIIKQYRQFNHEDVNITALDYLDNPSSDNFVVEYEKPDKYIDQVYDKLYVEINKNNKYKIKHVYPLSVIEMHNDAYEIQHDDDNIFNNINNLYINQRINNNYIPLNYFNRLHYSHPVSNLSPNFQYNTQYMNKPKTEQIEIVFNTTEDNKYKLFSQPFNLIQLTPTNLIIYRMVITIANEVATKITTLYYENMDKFTEYKNYYNLYHSLCLILMCIIKINEMKSKYYFDIMIAEIDKIVKNMSLYEKLFTNQNLYIDDFKNINDIMINTKYKSITNIYKMIHHYTSECLKYKQKFDKSFELINTYNKYDECMKFIGKFGDLIRPLKMNVNKCERFDVRGIKLNYNGLELEGDKYFQDLQFVHTNNDIICKFTDIFDRLNKPLTQQQINDGKMIKFNDISAYVVEIDNLLLETDEIKTKSNINDAIDNIIKNGYQKILVHNINKNKYTIDFKPFENKDMIKYIDNNMLKQIVLFHYAKTIKTYSLKPDIINNIKSDIRLDKNTVNQLMRNIYEQFANIYVYNNMNNIFVERIKQYIDKNNSLNPNLFDKLMIEPKEYTFRVDDIDKQLESYYKTGNSKPENAIKLIEDEDFDIYEVENDVIKQNNNTNYIFYSYDYYNKKSEMECIELNTEIIKLLFSKDVNIYATDLNGKTIIDYMVEGRMYYLLDINIIKSKCNLHKSIYKMLEYEKHHNELFMKDDKYPIIDNHQTDFINRLKQTDSIKSNIPINLKYIFHMFYIMQNIYWFRLINKTAKDDKSIEEQYKNNKLIEQYDWKTLFKKKADIEGNIKHSQQKLSSKHKKISNSLFSDGESQEIKDRRRSDISNNFGSNAIDTKKGIIRVDDITVDNNKHENDKTFLFYNMLFNMYDNSYNPIYYSYLWKKIANDKMNRPFIIYNKIIDEYNKHIDEVIKSKKDDGIMSNGNLTLDDNKISKLKELCVNFNKLYNPISTFIDARYLPNNVNTNMLLKFQVNAITHILTTLLGSNIYMVFKRLFESEIKQRSVEPIDDNTMKVELDKILKPLKEYLLINEMKSGNLSYDFLKAHMNFKDNSDQDYELPSVYFANLYKKLDNLEKYNITSNHKIIENIKTVLAQYYLKLYQETSNALINFSDGYYRMIKNQLLGIRFISML